MVFDGYKVLVLQDGRVLKLEESENNGKRLTAYSKTVKMMKLVSYVFYHSSKSKSVEVCQE